MEILSLERTKIKIAHKKHSVQFLQVFQKLVK